MIKIQSVLGELLSNIGYSYILYRIVHKFDNSMSFAQMLIPMWNRYLVFEIAIKNPITYFCCYYVTLLFLGYISVSYAYDYIIVKACWFISASLWAIPVAFIAQKLGKSLWLYYVLMLLPYVGYFTLIFLAFDNSRPTLAENTSSKESENISKDIIEELPKGGNDFLFSLLFLSIMSVILYFLARGIVQWIPV